MWTATGRRVEFENKFFACHGIFATPWPTESLCSLDIDHTCTVRVYDEGVHVSVRL